MSRHVIHRTLFLIVLAAGMPAVADGLSGATVGTPGGDAAAGQACQSDPAQCRAETKARMEQRCQENPQQCEKLKARLEEKREACKTDPEKCRAEMQTRIEQRFQKADTDGNGTLSREEAQKGMPMIARRFDQIDTNKDGQLSPGEIDAAAQQRAKTQRNNAALPQ